jgi:D-sedoheptulose 7-phosphate isomerase
MSHDPVAHLRELADHAARAADTLGPAILKAVDMFRATIDRAGTILFCGNGGSAADAQHMATEYVVRYRRSRRPIAALALTTDTSLITATGNDFDFDLIFARQVEALARPGDLLVIHTTSGNSPNILRAAQAARAKHVATLALSAKGGGKIADMVDHCIVVPVDRTDRAQELQLSIEHAICDVIDEYVADRPPASVGGARMGDEAASFAPVASLAN